MLQDFEVMRPRRRFSLARAFWYLVLSGGIVLLVLVGYFGVFVALEHY